MPPRQKLLAIAFVAIGYLAACGGPTSTPSETGTATEIETSGTSQSSQANRPQPSQPDQSAGATQSEGATPPDNSQQPVTTTSRFVAAGVEALDAIDRGVQEISWDDLLPAGEEERLTALYQAQMAQLYAAPVAEGAANDIAVQIGTFNTVAALDQTLIRIPGYTVPFDFGPDADITEFLLVPYFGACLHAPPPPPNQTIFVQTATPIKLADLAQAVWVEGIVSTQRQDTSLAGAAYTIQMDTIEEFEY